MAYSKVERRVWNDERFRRWTRDVRELWKYLLTSPHSNRLGCYVLDPLYAAGDLSAVDDRWTEERVTTALEVLQEEERILYDYDTRLVLLVNHFEHNAPENPNVVRGAITELRDLPLCPSILKRLAELIRRHIALHTKGSGEAFGQLWIDVIEERLGTAPKAQNDEPKAKGSRKGSRKGSANGSRNGSGNGSPNGMPNPEPKPEPNYNPPSGGRAPARERPPEPRSDPPEEPVALVPADTGQRVAISRPKVPPNVALPFPNHPWEERVSGAAVLAEWMGLQPLPLSRSDRDRYKRTCQRLADEHTCGVLALAFLGMQWLWPYAPPENLKGSKGEPWTPEDLRKVFPKAIAAAAKHPVFQQAQLERDLVEHLTNGKSIWSQ